MQMPGIWICYTYVGFSLFPLRSEKRHLRIALLLFVLGRAGCLNDGGIHQSALGHHDACFGQPAIDGLEQLTGQLMLLVQVESMHDGGAIRQGVIKP
ncbi:hypothetical protein BED23_21835 [Escherichia coli]|nr:hypothetical protein [Escherichia coli]